VDGSIGASIAKDWNPQMAIAAVSLRAGITLLAAALLALAMLVGASQATAEDAAAPTATPATTVTALGADPTVRVARHRHCVNRSVRMAPRYSGGGGLTASYLFINGARVATRHSLGVLRISAGRLLRGVNSFELISEFADGRAASVTGTIRRCGGR